MGCLGVLGQVDHDIGVDGIAGPVAGAQGLGGGACLRTGWDAFLAPVWGSGVVAGEHEPFEGEDVQTFERDLPGGAQPVIKTVDGKKVEQVEDKPFILDPLL